MPKHKQTIIIAQAVLLLPGAATNVLAYTERWAYGTIDGPGTMTHTKAPITK